MQHRLLVLVASILTALMGLPASADAGTTRSPVSRAVYDAPSIARCDAHAGEQVSARLVQVGVAREVSASPPAAARITSTTSSRSLNATNTVGLADDAVTTVGTKISGQMGSRGWSQSLIDDTLVQPSRTVITRDTRWTSVGTRLDDPATAYIRADGSYVVRNDLTGDIVQISNRNDPNWIAPWD